MKHWKKRLATLTELARKYKTRAELLPEKLEQTRAELAALDDPEQSIEQLQSKKSALEEDYKKLPAK